MSEKRWFPEGVIEADLVTSGEKMNEIQLIDFL